MRKILDVIVSGVFDDLRPWYDQRSGCFIGEVEVETNCGIEYALLKWGGDIEYHDNEVSYFLTSVSDSIMIFINADGDIVEHSYALNGDKELSRIKIFDELGYIELTWQSSDGFLN